MLELDVTLVKTPPDDRTGNWKWIQVGVEFATPWPWRDVPELCHLITATAASRILSSTCREARDAVSFVLPDICQMKVTPPTRSRTSQRPHISTGSFRFDARKDIFIIVGFYGTNMRDVLRCTSSGGMLDTFQSIQHLALDEI